MDVAPGTASTSSPPKPPSNTLSRERFIASHMILVRISPDAPTRAPLTIRAVLSSTNPVAAAASPEYELSKATTTGISAPPIGITSRIPSRKAIPTSAMTAQRIGWVSAGKLPAFAITSPKQESVARASSTVSNRIPGNEIGLPLILPLNLPTATKLPEKVMVPIRILSKMVMPMGTSNMLSSSVELALSTAR